MKFGHKDYLSRVGVSDQHTGRHGHCTISLHHNKDCIQTLTCHHFCWELNIWSMGGPVQEAYVVMRLDLTEIACTPAIGSWTLTTRGTIFKWQPPESWTNFTRPRKWNDWYKSTIPEQNAQPSYLAAVTVQKESWWIFYLGVTSPGKTCPDD